MFEYDRAEQIEGSGGGMGNGIDYGAGMDNGLDIRKGNGPELAEEPGVGTSDGSVSNEGPANCAGLHDRRSNGMFA